MVIRSTTKTDGQSVAHLIDFFENYEQFAYEVFEDTVDMIRPEALNELRHEPGKVKYPIEWTSERQRRAFFATNGFGGGIPYQRTGKLAQAWTIEAIRDGNTYLMVIENKAKAAAFVYGSLAQNRTSALRFQQRFHANTGWQPATDTVKFWQDAFEEQFAEELESQTAIAFKRRAFTRTR